MNTTFSSLEKKPADKSGVKLGEQVGVIGLRLPTGELIANEVILGVPPPKVSAAKSSDEKKPKHNH